MTIKAVVFDLDGTLASFNLDYRTVRAEVKSFLISAGLPGSILSVNESVFEMLKKVEIFMMNTGKSEKTTEEVRAKALKMVERYELEAAKCTSLMPGVIETLKILKKMGLKIGLCTINSERSMNYILERFNIAKFFDATTPRNRVKYVKPNSEHLQATLKALQARPEETLVVGDGTTDMHCAKELGSIGTGLPTGVSTADDLASAGAKHLISSLAELPVLIGQINKSQGS